jgi:hypothetical protein
MTSSDGTTTILSTDIFSMVSSLKSTLLLQESSFSSRLPMKFTINTLISTTIDYAGADNSQMSSKFYQLLTPKKLKFMTTLKKGSKVSFPTS